MRAGDPAWTAKLRQTFEATLAAAGNDARGVNFSVSEEYRDPPADLAPTDDRALGWTCRIRDGEVIEFARAPASDVDGRVQLDYDVFAELAAIVIAGDPDKQEQTERRAASALAEGRMVITGTFDTAPPWLMANVHDIMARVTDTPMTKDAP
jgi:hypothetical protein